MVTVARTAKPCPPLLGGSRADQQAGHAGGFVQLLEDRLEEFAGVFRTKDWHPGEPASRELIRPSDLEQVLLDAPSLAAILIGFETPSVSLALVRPPLGASLLRAA